MKNAKLFPFFILFTCALLGQVKKNVLLICVDDLRPELNSFGAKHIISPNIDDLAKNGRAFYNHYVNAPSCGPSRYTMLTGTYEKEGVFKNTNGAFARRKTRLIEHPETIHPSMPEWFKQQGYTTISLGKVSHIPGGLAGKEWNDSNEIQMPNAWDKSYVPVGVWKSPKGIMHGLANGQVRKKPADMDVFQSEKGEDDIYPDGLIANAALDELTKLKDSDKPFFFAVGFIRPHLPFGAPNKYYKMYKGVKIPEAPFSTKPSWSSTWHGSGEFMKYNRWDKDPRKDKKFAKKVKRHYAACVTYADAQIGKVIRKLKELDLDKNTTIVLWGDHGWSLNDHAIWGKHSLFEEALHSPLIIVDPSIVDKGEGSNAVIETVDIFPTLCSLTDIPTPDFIDGTSLTSILNDPKESGHNAYAYKNGSKSIRTDKYRLIIGKEGSTELYDHTVDQFETKNIAKDTPEIVKDLKELIKNKDSKRH